MTTTPEPSIETLDWYYDENACAHLPSSAERLRWVFAIHMDACSRSELITWALTRGYSKKGAENRYGETRAFVTEMDGMLAE